MASKYLPPHLRNKTVPERVPSPVPEPEPLLEELSTLKVSDTKSSRPTFAKLAAEWAKDNQEQMTLESFKKQEDESISSLRKNRMAPLPQFHNIRHFVEPEEENQEQVEKNTNPDEEGWVEVKRKKKYVRKNKMLDDDEPERAPSPEEEKEEQKDTVWDQQDDEDTYWKNR